jgi:glycosyltransferase involved in cell wall biosynthesis
MFSPTFVDIGIFIGTIGFFFVLFLLYARTFPVIAQAEVKTILKSSGERYKNIRERGDSLVGTGADEAELRTLAGGLGLSAQVIFAGFHSDPTPFYQTADLFVLSSDYEGFGNVIVEAMACGTPVVSTDCPSGPAEILENGRYGRLVPVRDAQALADAMQEALAAPHDPALLKQRASDFAPEIAAKRYLELLCP